MAYCHEAESIAADIGDCAGGGKAERGKGNWKESSECTRRDVWLQKKNYLRGLAHNQIKNFVFCSVRKTMV